MKTKLLTLDRRYKQIITLAFDVIILVFALWLSFALRFGELWNSYIDENLWLFLLVPIVSTPLFVKLGLYRSVLQYIGIKVITTSFQSYYNCLFYNYILYVFLSGR